MRVTVIKRLWLVGVFMGLCQLLPTIAMAKEYPGAKPPELSDSIDVRFYGGKGTSDYYSCKEGFQDAIFKGGSGGADISKCPNDFMTVVSIGGKGKSDFSTCPDDLMTNVSFGGKGQSHYTTCPDNLMSMVSKGGDGQSHHTTCPDNFMSMVSKGGEGQSVYTTCPDNFMSVISKGGEGQTAYTTCPDNFMDIISKGAKGQSFFSSCMDVVSLYIQKIALDAVSCINRTNQFKISISNTATAIYDLQNVLVKDSVGLGLDYASWTATSGTFNPTTKIWTVPSILKGETHSLTLTTKATQAGTLTNYAWIQSASQKAYVRDTVTASILSKSGGINRADIRVQVCPAPNRQIDLTSYLNTDDFTSAKWKTLSGPPISLVGELQTHLFEAHKTYTYRTRVVDECLDDSVVAYVTVLDNKYLGPQTRTIALCYKDAKSVNINSMLGLNASGTWTSITPGATTYLSINGIQAEVFNAEKAFTDNNGIATIPHNGGLAKKISLQYKIDNPQSCLHNQTFTLHLMITDSML